MEFHIGDRIVCLRKGKTCGKTGIIEGAIGIAQASSYALKKILEKLNSGSLTKFD